jgi:hypothetical protein
MLFELVRRFEEARAPEPYAPPESLRNKNGFLLPQIIAAAADLLPPPRIM